MAGDNIFTQIIDAVKGDVKRGRELVGPTLTSPLSGEMEKFYVTNDDKVRTNWYRQRPYAFRFTNRNGVANTFYLPIAPSNITINTHFATNVITTMYGTVEEHSEQRYYDITIAGTTAMMPRYYKLIEEQATDLTQRVGRVGLPVNASFSDVAGGFFKRTISLLRMCIFHRSQYFYDFFFLFILFNNH